MRRLFTYTSCFILIHLTACKTDASKSVNNPVAPTVEKKNHAFSEYGTQRLDEYFWLSDPTDSAVIRHLNAENDYTAKMLAHTEGVQKTLYDEMVSRVEQVNADVPIKKNGYWYYRRFEAGKEYPLICRKKESWATTEEILLDLPKLAEGHKIFRLYQYAANPDNTLLAYLVDTAGDRRNTLYIKDLRSNILLKETLNNVATNGLVWSNNGKHFFYVLNDPTVRGYKVMRHTLGADAKTDPSVFEEKDNTFSVEINKSNSKKLILISSNSTTTSEVRYLDADAETIATKIVQPRQTDVLYSVNHYEGDTFYIHNNYQAKNFKLSVAPIKNSGLTHWKDLVPHSDSSLLESFEVLKNYVLLQDKTNGLNKIRVINRTNGLLQNVDFGEDVYEANLYFGDQDNFNSDSLRYNYQSLTTPNSVFHYDIPTKAKTILKQDKIAGYNLSKYESKRVWVTSRDSVLIPLSIVYRKDLFKHDGSNPLFLYAYGSYGFSTSPNFNQSVVSLLDRGFVYCIAHIRGGQELGRKWYEDGKLLKKKNTFNDFVDAADFLVKDKFTASDKLFANGGSAGGMLMGAVINQRPELWRGVIAEVPWMDVITDMFNDKLPLTTLEYDEWGNPNKKEYYDYMLSWSPYDNVKRGNYPAILATGGLNDTQVPYFSPAKWVARVRDNNVGKNPILFKCNMDAGHGGQSGRFDRYKLTALKYAFMLDLLDNNKK
jgi:oligopeptidase B